jgi:polysaccharide export outer membrane protein
MNFRRHAVGRVATAFLVFATLVGCAPNRAEQFQKTAEDFNPTAEGAYRIGIDDRVQVSVWRNPDLSVTVPVRPDGMISIPLIGDVQAGGRTPAQVADTIRQKLSSYIRDPSVAVILTELRSHEFLSRVRVTGAVRNPRSLPFRQGMTVLDAVLEAGGVNEFASPNRAKLYRKANANTDVLDLELGDILSKGKMATNVLLIPGDVITVPERLF